MVIIAPPPMTYRVKSILGLLQDSLPENIAVQEKLETLITKKNSYIKKLQKRWMARTVTIYSERDIREVNLEYIDNLLQNRANQTVKGFWDQCNKDSKSWILNQSSKWLEWNPTENQYFNQAIEFKISQETLKAWLFLMDRAKVSI